MDLTIRSLAKEIKADNRLFIKELYNHMRPEFMAWFKKHFYCSQEDIEDAYQRAFNIFYFNVKEDRINMPEIKANTYLFSVGKNIMLKVLSKVQKNETPIENLNERSLGMVNIDYDMDSAYRKEVIVRLLNHIGDTCRKVLMLAFYRNFSMESIASELNFKSESVAKKKKHLCLKKLKELAEKHRILRDSLV
jgi:RNA polymerase sigma factor (sigma-70 family)